MTAEIAVHNRYGIALAADSAASVSHENDSHKVFNNAEKLFELSRTEPVGLMIYGLSELQNFPWELLIKAYREELGTDFKDTVEQYAYDFVSFAGQMFSSLPDTFVETVNSNSVFTEVFQCIDKLREQAPYYSNDPNNSLDIDSLLESAKFWNELIEKAPMLTGFDESDFGLAKAQAMSILERVVNHPEAFGDSFDANASQVNKQLLERTAHLVANELLRENPLDRDFTGVVVAGYGKQEFFPCVFAYEVYGVFNGKLRYRIDKKKCCTIPGSAGVIPFAQDTEVGTFMNGLHPSLNKALSQMENSFSQLAESQFDKALEHIADDQLRAKLKSEFLEDAENQRDSIRGEMIKSIRKVSNKVTEMLEHLPKYELAYMAESLVNLTAFKRKVSKENESVGGPIDVALISKYDGFVWVKRKHYFSGELNKNYHLKKLLSLDK